MHINDLAELLYRGWSDYVRDKPERPIQWPDLTRAQQQAWKELAALVDYRLSEEVPAKNYW